LQKGPTAAPAPAKSSWSFREAIDRIDASSSRTFHGTSLKEKVAAATQSRRGAAAATSATGTKVSKAPAGAEGDDASSDGDDEGDDEDDGEDSDDSDDDDNMDLTTDSELLSYVAQPLDPHSEYFDTIAQMTYPPDAEYFLSGCVG
jgi:hypothetical protein